MLRVTAALAVVASAAQAQSPAVGVELQGYPAGVIPAVFVEVDWGSLGLLSGSLGWNFTYRRDFGEHDDERGGGPGAGLAWQSSRGGKGSGLIFGARVDLWFMDVDWRDPGPRAGSTEVTVFQPTARVGYAWNVGAVRGAILVGLGWEVNVRTVGEPVGEGPILLLGARVALRQR